MKNKILKFVLAFIMMFVPMTMITNVNASENSPLKVSAEISDRPDLKIFKVYNSSHEDLDYTYNATGKDIKAHIQAGHTNTHEFENQQGTIVFQLVDEKGRYSIPCQSLSSYKLRVRYLYQGENIQSPSSVTCSPNAVSRITAPKTISKNGRVYDIVGGNYREASYGETSVDFQYTMRSRDDFQSSIVFLDQDGNTLKRDKMNVSENNGGFYAVPQTLEHNQRQYRLMAGYGDIQQSYDEGVKTHYVRYQLQANTSNAPYYITIDYRDGNTLLTRKTLTVQKGKPVSYLAPSVYNVGTTSYKLVSNGQVTHQYGDAIKNYTVQYTKEVTDRNQPYDVYVHYVDVATGKTLKSVKQNVGVSKTVKFEVPGSVTSANKNYILSAGQPKTITHKFGNEQTVYTVYFHEKDIDVKEYQVTVSYFDLTENKVIYTTKMNATSDKALSINVPSRYNANGNEYVLLSGQETSINHDFYSTRRNYTFIYRNVEDLENQNVVVIPGDHQNVVESPNGSVVTIDRTTGTTTVTIPENNTPLVINNNGQLVPPNDTNQGTTTVTVPENNTPLVKGQTQIQNQTPYIIGGSVLVLSGIVVILFLLKKRKKKTEE